jgi:hypothetical protein
MHDQHHDNKKAGKAAFGKGDLAGAQHHHGQMRDAKDTNHRVAGATGGVKRVKRDIQLIGRDSTYEYFKVARSLPEEDLFEREFYDLDDDWY